MGNTIWTRAQLKQRAKGKLKTFYLQAFLACLIAMVLGAGTNSANFSTVFKGSSGSGGSSNGYDGVSLDISTPFFTGRFPAAMAVGILVALVMALAVTAVVLIVKVMLSNVVQVGKCSYFIRKAAGDQGAGISELFSMFSRDYRNVAYVMFRCGLSVFLWSLLLVVPGIIKAYQYCMVPYLLAEDPGMSWVQAKERSAELMEGNKMAVFVLQLSFIGWDILGALLCGIGHIFVAPYKEATYAELFHVLKGRGASAGGSSSGWDSQEWGSAGGNQQASYPNLEF